MYSPTDQARIAELRMKQAAGTITVEDLKDFIRITREGRISAQATSTTARTKAAKVAIPNADALLDQLVGGV